MSFETSPKTYDDEIEALRQKGIRSSRSTWKGWSGTTCAIAGPIKSVWFSDPDGNILNVSTGEM